MTAGEIVTALDLPAASRVDQRVPKKLLLENGSPTAADKRLITEGIEELFWIAALKPTTIGVVEFRDEIREYVEIAVLRMTMRAGAKAARLIELVHRAVPYPVLLLTEFGEYTNISAAHKRWSQSETGQTVLDGDIVVVDLDASSAAELSNAFSLALTLDSLPRSDLYAFYQGWIASLTAYKAACITGRFEVATTPEISAARLAALIDIESLDAEIARVRSAATKEIQMAKQIALNLELKKLEAKKTAAHAKL